VPTPRFLLSNLFTTFNRMAISKFLSDAFGEKDIEGGGYLPSDLF
jgi:hypothetical protein